MKKVIFSIILVLFTVNFGHAQVFRLGVKAGLNYANFQGSTLQTDAITSYHAGLVGEIKIIDAFSLQPEVLYSTQGASYKNAVEEFKSELGYVSVPVLVKINLGKTVSIDVGPQFSFLLSKKIDTSTDINEFDFALAGGLGFKLTENFFIQGRYTLGLTEIDKNADFKNSVGQLSVGFMF
ncbi:porin family protein [Flavobacterium sp.]|uniref:porin family protein n=1 Tax=Flavobacterium sp. TaxID=239 RepID=UPI003D6B1E61